MAIVRELVAVRAGQVSVGPDVDEFCYAPLGNVLLVPHLLSSLRRRLENEGDPSG